MTTQTKYSEQWNRVRRWYHRFSELSEGKLHDSPSDFYQDEVYAFFLNCYHLKDWIMNDPTVSSHSDNVENFITNDPDLSLCADICNGIKHLDLSKSKRKTRSNQNPHFGKRFFRVGVGTQPTTIAVEYTIDTKSGTIDAFDLATRCIEAWEIFLRRV